MSSVYGGKFWAWEQPWVKLPFYFGMSSASLWLMYIFTPSIWPLALMVSVLFGAFTLATMLTWLVEGRPR